MPVNAIVTIAGGKVKHHWFNNKKESVRQAQKMASQGVDVYWAMATFDERSRKADAVQSVQSFWLDLDCGEGKPYATKKEALQTVLGSFLPKPSMVVDSGNGIHIYWQLTSPETLDEWLPVAKQLKRACVTHGIHADHTVTSDAARILRVPGTFNYKNPDAPKKVRLLTSNKTRYSLSSFSKDLPVPAPKPVAQVSSEWQIEEDYPPVELKTVLSGCKQIRDVVRVQGNNIEEPYWRAVLSVVWRCDNGEYLIHGVSKGDPRYDPHETQAKAQATLGPATCEHFDAVNPGVCGTCPMSGAVKSPIAILPPAPEPEIEGSEDTQERPTKIGDWHITVAGVYRVDEDDQGVPRKQWAVRTPVYGDTFRTRVGEIDVDADDARIILTWLRPDGAWRRSQLPLSLLGSAARMMEWAGAQGIATLIPNPKVWSMFISELTNSLLSTQSVSQYYSRLGWHNADTEFVLGKQMITADGVDKANLERNSPLSQIEPRGSLAEWKEGISVLERAGFESQMFCVLAGFGAPLLQIMDVAGAAVSLAGSSGKGKTLAAKAALSIYGNPDQLFQSADATNNSVDAHLATLHSVPYLMDEVTNLPDKRIGALLYMIANGRGKDSLTRNRTWRDGGSWRTLAFLTTNRPIMDAGQDTLTEAQRNRAIELIITQGIEDKQASQVYNAISKNHGVAAAPYLQWVISNKEKCVTLFDAALKKVKNNLGDADAQRFGVWALAAALTGGLIARELNLIDRNPWDIVQHVIPVLRQQTDDTDAPEEMFVNTLSEWLTRESAKVVYSNGPNIGLVDDPIARCDGSDLYVHQARLKVELRDQQVSMSILRNFITEHDITRTSMRLASGTPPVRVLKLPAYLVFDD